MRKYTFLVYILITSLLFLFRVVFFAGRYGGVEHDSGWFAGVARNLAQRGIYASYTNTIKEERIGPYPNIHGRYSVQDIKGFSYFPAGVTVGPGYIIPEALMMKLFGFGFWQLRAWPLISFLAMLILLFYLTHSLGGYISLLILQVWLWVIPQLYITFAYEGFGEHIALFYLLASFYFLWTSLTVKKKGWVLFASGVFFSLSILTKYLTLLAGGTFFVLALYDFYNNRGKLKKTATFWSYFIIGTLIPIGLFEIYRYLTLTLVFDKSAWDAINADFLLHFKANGSGTNLKNLDWDFILKKLFVWSKVGITLYIFPWIIFLVSPIIFLKKYVKSRTILFLILFSSSLIFCFWYLLFSPTGWARHSWLGLVLAMAVISGVLGRLFVFKKRFGYLISASLVILFGLIAMYGKSYNLGFFLNQKDIEKWRMERYQGGLQGLPHTDTFSLADQKELIYYFQSNISDADKVYYLGWFLVAEASPLVDKVFYSLDRYLEIGQANPQGGRSFLIIGPYQKGKFSIMSKDYHDKKITELCDSVVFINSSYTLCTLQTSLEYENRAYD